MGPWGLDTFENDTALDWVYELEEGGMPFLRATLEKAGPSSDYIESHDGCEILAACDTAARLAGRFGQKDSYTQSVDAWVAAQGGPAEADVMTAALSAIDRVLGGASELAELREEADELEAWKEVVEALRDRLTP